MQVDRGRGWRGGVRRDRGAAARSDGARHQHAAPERARSVPPAARIGRGAGRAADPVPVLARRRDRPDRRYRDRRRRLCREAVLPARGGRPGRRDPETRAAARPRPSRAAGDRPQPAVARSGRLGSALGRRAGADHRDRVPAAAAARLGAVAGLLARCDHRSAARPRLRDHRPDYRQPCPQPARQVRGRGLQRSDRDPRRHRLPDRRLRFDPPAQGFREGALAGAQPAHDPVRHLAVRRGPARHRRDVPARL